MFIAIVVLLVIVAGAVYFARKSHTVDSIVADIDAKVKQLDDVAYLHLAESLAHQEVIDKASELKAFAVKEKDRAVAIAERFKALIK